MDSGCGHSCDTEQPRGGARGQIVSSSGPGHGRQLAPVSAPSTLPHSPQSAFVALLPLQLKKKMEICGHLNDSSRRVCGVPEIPESTFPLNAHLVGQARSLLDLEGINP